MNYHIALQRVGAAKTAAFCQKLDIGRAIRRVPFLPALIP
jgi:hypothetical protein